MGLEVLTRRNINTLTQLLAKKQDCGPHTIIPHRHSYPNVRKFARTTKGDSDEERWLAFDGVVSYVEHELKEIVLELLHLKIKRTTHQTQQDIRP